MPFRTSLIAAAVAGAMSASPAFAQTASASADLSQFSYQLIDLDLTDSIAPAITFTERIVSTSYHDDGSGSVDYQQIEAFGATSITRPFGSASTSASATASRAAASFSLSTPDFQVLAGQHFYGWDFELTPSTGILFSTKAVLNAAHSGDGTRSLAAASMFGYLSHFGAESLEQSTFNDLVAIETGTRSYTLSGYLHSGQEALTGAFGFGSEATVVFYGASPVPEPSAYGMLLAGLGLLGWRARRRQAER